MPANGPDEEIVTFRLPARDRAAIQRLVDAGAFQNRSDLLRTAIRNLLREQGIPSTPLDLELDSAAPLRGLSSTFRVDDGVDLPSAGPARARGRSTINKRNAR